jgi:hypothetical protein
LGYRNEIYRAEPVKPASIAAGSFCVPAILKDWAARGWAVFDGIEHSEKSATQANAKDSSIDGLSYSLHHCHENDQEKIFLRIDSWRYDKFGETTDLPVLEIIFDASHFSSPARALESMKVMARPVPLSEKAGARVINAALFLIHQINNDQVPDFERVLALHRVHPESAKNTGAGMENEGE